jgi:hypothetical protein
MKKIAIITEGQTELILIRYILTQISDLSKISFECIKIQSGRQIPVNYDYTNKHAEIHFLIANVEGDNKVLSTIIEREKHFYKVGFERIIGIRDMYSDEYKKRSSSSIYEIVNTSFINAVNEVLNEQCNSSKIGFYFSIMEVEAWFLLMHQVFNRIDSRLTLDMIEQNLKVNLAEIDPQECVFHPAIFIKKIFKLIGDEYDKTEDQVNRICANLNFEDYKNANNGVKCSSFRDFYKEINNCLGNAVIEPIDTN